MDLNRRDLEEVIQDVLDGVASADEIAWLERRRAEDPTAQSLYERRKGLFQVLAQVEELPAPADLSASVLSALPAKSRPRPGGRRWLSVLPGAPSPRISRWAIPFAAGVAAGVVLMVALTGSPALRSREGLQTAGTMAAPSASRPAAAQDSEELTVGATRVAASIMLNGDSLIAHLECRATEEAQITIEYDPAVIAATSLEWSRPDEQHAALQPGYVRLRVRGDPQARVRFLGAGSGGATCLEVSLQTAAGVARGTLSADAPRRARE